eukprot:scaffold119372_cov45-Prasinocladus_malaysianus.AAC.1
MSLQCHKWHDSIANHGLLQVQCANRERISFTGLLGPEPLPQLLEVLEALHLALARDRLGDPHPPLLAELLAKGLERLHEGQLLGL